ncbi:MAG: DUF86 domain-containing protein [Holophagaceae bacterium]|nr:DUF86 domain-containing protein [Holophagaceae bacterium]
MRPDPLSTRVRLLHMVEACNRAQAFIEDRERADLEKDEMLRLALQYLVLTLGEAAKHIPQETQLMAPTIPWRAMAASRDRMAHGYFDINLDMLWAMASVDIPALREGLNRLLEQDGAV